MLRGWLTEVPAARNGDEDEMACFERKVVMIGNNIAVRLPHSLQRRQGDLGARKLGNEDDELGEIQLFIPDILHYLFGEIQLFDSGAIRTNR